MIQFVEHIFQMGWFNHQLVEFLGCNSQVLEPIGSMADEPVGMMVPLAEWDWECFFLLFEDDRNV